MIVSPRPGIPPAPNAELVATCRYRQSAELEARESSARIVQQVATGGFEVWQLTGQDRVAS